MRSLLRALAHVLSAVGFLLLLLLALVGGALWLTLPRSNQVARIPGLTAPVDVTFDQDGVPRIRAANDLDAAAALGFVHARDRMFEMELMRRNASGRLSEIAGPVDAAARPADAHAGAAAGADGQLCRPATADSRGAGGLCQRRERVDRATRTLRRAGVPGAGRARTAGRRSTACCGARPWACGYR